MSDPILDRLDVIVSEHEERVGVGGTDPIFDKALRALLADAVIFSATDRGSFDSLTDYAEYVKERFGVTEDTHG